MAFLFWGGEPLAALDPVTATFSPGLLAIPRTVSFDSNGALASIAMDNQSVRLWNLESASQVASYEFQGEITAMAYSPDAASLAVAAGTNDVQLFSINPRTGLIQGQRKIVTVDPIDSLSFTDDGRTLMGITLIKGVTLWDTKSTKNFQVSPGSWVTQDNNPWLTKRDPKFLKIPEFESIKPILITTMDAVSPQKDFGLTKIPGGFRLFDDSGQRDFVSGEAETTALAISPSNRMIATSGADGAIRLWDRSDPVPWETIPINGTKLTSLSFAPNNKSLVSTSDDGVVRYWDVNKKSSSSAQNRLMVSMITATSSERSDDYVAWTPEGFFSGTSWAAQNLVQFDTSFGKISPSQAFDVLYRPDLVADRLEGLQVSQYAVDLGGMPPEVEILSPETATTSAGRDIELEFRVTDKGGGVGNIRVSVNNNVTTVNVTEKNRREFEPLTYRVAMPITLFSGQNVIEVSTGNGENKIRSAVPASITINYFPKDAPPLPKLFLLSVAVSDYTNSDYKLLHRVDDAKWIISTLKTYGKGVFSDVVLLDALYDKDADSPDKISAALASAKRRVGPDDYFVLLITGHGFLDRGSGEYSFVTSQYQGSGTIGDRRFLYRGRQLVLDFQGVVCNRKLMILDTCNAGTLLPESEQFNALYSTQTESNRMRTDSATLTRLSPEAGGAFIGTSYVPSYYDTYYHETFSFDDFKDGHGSFAEVFVNGIERNVPASRNGDISIHALLSFVELELPRQTLSAKRYEQNPAVVYPKSQYPIARR